MKEKGEGDRGGWKSSDIHERLAPGKGVKEGRNMGWMHVRPQCSSRSSTRPSGTPQALAACQRTPVSRNKPAFVPLLCSFTGWGQTWEPWSPNQCSNGTSQQWGPVEDSTSCNGKSCLPLLPIPYSFHYTFQRFSPGPLTVPTTTVLLCFIKSNKPLKLRHSIFSYTIKKMLLITSFTINPKNFYIYWKWSLGVKYVFIIRLFLRFFFDVAHF